MLTNQHTDTYVGTINEDYCTICFYLYSSEVTSLGSFVRKRLNLYFWTVNTVYEFFISTNLT